MATGQTLLNLMELLNQELQLQAGEPDVTRGLIALNAAQDHFEAMASLERGLFGDQVGTVATVASTETTTFPTGLLRVDRLQFLDPSTSRPVYDLEPHDDTGGHAPSHSWPYNVLSTSSAGRPSGYWTNGRSIYWDPLPDGAYNVRWYGFQAASDITASGTFAYPDILMLPLASFAVQLMKIGVDDDAASVGQVGQATFGPVIESLSSFRRDGASGLRYKYIHDT
jgi:hypothetical protein